MYLYGTNWTQQARLTASDAATGAYFGYSVSLQGNTALIGAYYDDASTVQSGSAYVFVRSGTNWTFQTKLTASDASAGDWFASSVSISRDTALIGAYTQGDASFDDPGAAYVFVRDGTSWRESSKLTAHDSERGDRFAYAVGISGDTAMIGAYSNDEGDTNTGAVYCYLLYADSDGDGVSDQDEVNLYETDLLAADTDGDGIPDIWEDHFRLGSDVKNGTLDSDGDGFSNLEEYIADTNPTRSFEFFRLRTTDTAVIFLSSANRYYTLQFRSDLKKDAWEDVPGQITVPGTGSLYTMDYLNNTSCEFYRVKVQLRP